MFCSLKTSFIFYSAVHTKMSLIRKKDLPIHVFNSFVFFHTKAEAETNDNLQFLSTLLPWFEKLHYATKSADMVSVFPPLVHTLYLVWVHSR